MRLQGTGASQLVQMIREVGRNDFDEFSFATVISAPPNLRIKVDGMPIELEADDIVIAERLTKYPVRLRASDGTVTEYTVDDELAVGDRVITASMNNGQTYVVLDKAVKYIGA
jgi:hypothetical protein